MEPFVLNGEDAATALAEGSARRMALDAALAEIDAGLEYPSIEWRREYSLLLGLERLLNDDEPHLADGAVLNPHQVDALSGTLAALTAEIQASNNGSRPAPEAVEELPSDEVEIEGDEEISDEDEPLDWDEAEEAEEEAAADAPGRPRTRTPPGGSGSSTPPAPARPWRPWASSRPRAPAAC